MEWTYISDKKPKCSICHRETWCSTFSGKVGETLYEFYICDSCRRESLDPHPVLMEIHHVAKEVEHEI